MAPVPSLEVGESPFAFVATTITTIESPRGRLNGLAARAVSGTEH